MIKVTFTEEGEKLSLRLEGHAGYAEIGKDTVCASASILAYTVAQFVRDVDKRGGLKSPSEMKLEPGEAFISCEPDKSHLNTMKNLYLFAKVGYMLLKHNYPQYVDIIDDKANALT